jgi:uncharacterized damage-inducible protein DinB
MNMKEYIIETFQFNDITNKNLLRKIEHLPDRTECIKVFSHLINSQYKWMARIVHDPAAPEMSWWDPVYPFERLEQEWEKSLQLWIDYLPPLTEQQILEEVDFIGFDGGTWAARLIDIALQLNYHSIHHRAQIQTIIRAQGLEPDFVDYIGTKYRKIS